MVRRHRFGPADPKVDLAIASRKQRFIVIERFVIKPGQMVLREPPEKKVCLLHAGIAGLINQSADPGAAGFGHGT